MQWFYNAILISFVLKFYSFVKGVNESWFLKEGISHHQCRQVVSRGKAACQLVPFCRMQVREENPVVKHNNSVDYMPTQIIPVDHRTEDVDLLEWSWRCDDEERCSPSPSWTSRRRAWSAAPRRGSWCPPSCGRSTDPNRQRGPWLISWGWSNLAIFQDAWDLIPYYM